MYFPYFVIISPWKKAGPFIWKKIESPSPKDALCQVWLKFAQLFGEEDENVKSSQQCQQRGQWQQRRQTTDKFWSEKLTWAFVSGELKKGQKGADLHRKSIKHHNSVPNTNVCNNMWLHFYVWNNT